MGPRVSDLNTRLRISADGAELVAEAKRGEQALDGLDKRVAKVGQTSAQTAAAMRMVPAQITDIVTSLASGQAPMQVFIQQGGQLKDQFGGIAPAARAVGTYVAGLVNPMTLAAAAVGGLAAAYALGAREESAMRQALVLSGNAAGVTTGQMREMAQAIAQVAGTQGEAAAALGAFVRSGTVGRENLQAFAQTAVEFERTTGTAVADTVDAYSRLAKEPLKASLELNQAHNYLTESVYRQIRALEEQGKKSEAAKVAMEAYRSAQARMSEDIRSNMGDVEKAWNAATRAVMRFGSAILSIGREAGAEQQLAAQRAAIAGLEQKLAQRQAAGSATGQIEAQLAAARSVEASLRQQVELNTANAAEEAKRAERVKRIAALDQQGVMLDGARLKLAQEIALVENARRDGIFTEEQAHKRIAALREHYADKGAASKAEAAVRKAEQDRLRDLEEQRKVMAEALGVTGDYVETLGRLERAYVGGAFTQEQYVKAIEALIQKQPIANRWIDEITTSEKLRAEIARDAQQAIAKANDEQFSALEKLRESVQAERERVEVIGLTEVALHRRALAQMDNVIADREKTLGDLQLQDGSETAIANLAEEIRLLKERRALIVEGRNRGIDEEVKRQAAGAADAYVSEMQRGADDSARAITDSIMRSTEQGRDMLESMWNAFKGTVNSSVLRPMVDAAARPVSTAISTALGVPSTANAATGAIGALGSLGTFSSSFGASIASTFSGPGLFATLGEASALIQGGATSAGLGMGAGALAPYLGAAMLVYQLLSKKGGGPKQGGSFSTGGDRLFTPTTADGLLAGLGSGLLDQVGAFTSRYGGSLTGATVSLGYDQDPIGTAGSRIASRVVGADGRVILDNSAGRDVGRDQDKFEAELQIEAQRVLLAALQASDLENGFADIFGRLDPATAAPEAVTNILALADTLYQVGEAAKGLPGAMGQVATLSATAREQLVGLAGGVQALTAAQQTFYSEFLTSSERYAIDTQRIGEAFARAVGQPIEALTAGRNAEEIRATFRDLVLGIDLTSDAGIAAYAALTGMSGALSQWIDDSVELGRVASGASDAVEDLAASVESSFGDVQAAMREIAPAAETLVDAWRRGKSEIESIRAALGLDGGTSGSASLIAQMQRYGALASGYGSARTTLQGSIFETGLAAMSPADQAAALRQRAAGVWGTLQGSDDPAAVIGQYTDLILRAIRADGAASMAGQQAIYDAEYQGALDAQRLAKEARQDQVAVLTAQREAWEDQIDALERMRDFSREMRDYVTDLRIGDLSILSPTDRIGVAGAAFRTNLAGARAGDEASQRDLTSSATAYLTETRKFFASSAEYVKVFQEVTGALDSLGLASARPEDQISLLREQITTAETQIERLKIIEDQQIELRKATIDTSAAEIEALRAIDSAAAAAQAYLLTEIQKQRSDLADHLETLQTIVDQQQAQIAQQAAIQAALQEQLDGIRSNTGATAAAVAASRSAPVAVG